jgi:hypothetical protein
VTSAPAERTAVMVIRAWIEANGELRLRARITQTFDLEREAQTSNVAASRAQITAAVDDWLDLFLGDAALTER